VGADGKTVRLGQLGQLTPALAAARGLPNTEDDVYVAELDLDALDSVAVDRDELTATPVPRYPSIVRDLAIVVDHALPAAAVRETIRTAAPDTLVSVREFDRYDGKGIPGGCISLALRLTFRASDRTLTDTEVQGAVDRVVKALEQQHEAKLR
jgi:phenylalanyl-tRNA synthetase beta chain